MGCSSSKSSQVHSPGNNKHSGRDYNEKDTETKKPPEEKAIQSILPHETTGEKLIRAGVEPPGTVPSETTAKAIESKLSSPTLDPSESTADGSMAIDSEEVSKDGSCPFIESTEEPQNVAGSSTEAAPVQAEPVQEQLSVFDGGCSTKAAPVQEDPVQEQLSAFNLQAVSVLETEIKDVFDVYKKRLQPQLVETFDCTWEKLEHAMEECKSMGIILEWFWIVGDEVTNAPADAHGLVVIKVDKAHSSKKGELVHLSVAGKDWEPKMPLIIDTLRRETFRNLSIKSIQVTLWYSEQEGTGKFAINPAIESIFQKKGFKWRQLTNTRDGRRGQVMGLQRTEGTDPEMPEQIFNLTVSLCTFLAVGGSNNNNDIDDDASGQGAMASRVMIAESLRRHGGDLKIEETFTVGGNSDSQEEDSGVPSNQVEDLMKCLCKRKKVQGICSKDAAKLSEAEEFVKEYLPNLPSKTMTEVSTWLMKKEGIERVICSGVALNVDWQEHTNETDSYFKVPVRMCAKSAALEHPLAYLGTNDDDIFVIVWPCEKDVTQSKEEFIQQCANTLRNVEQIEQPLPFDEILLPRFALQSFEASMDIHHPAFKSMKCDGVHKPRQLVAVNVTAGQVYPGALKKATPKKTPVVAPITSTGSFVFCVSHANLDDLEEPLFVARVDVSD